MVITQVMTIDQFENLHDDRVELIDGELHEMAPPSEDHGDVAREIVWQIESHIRPLGIEKLLFDTTFAIDREHHTALVPDIAFVRADRLDPGRDTTKLVGIPPDLAIEVLSPTDRPGIVRRKIERYLAAGVRVVVVIDPIRGTASVVRPEVETLRLTSADALDLSDVIADLSIPLSAVFR